MQNGSTAFRFVRLAVLPFFAVKSTLLKVRCTHYSEIFLYSPESLFASFLWKYPNSKTLMERRSSIIQRCTLEKEVRLFEMAVPKESVGFYMELGFVQMELVALQAYIKHDA